MTHDDVIGTRRVSYILYLPVDEPKWEPEVRLDFALRGTAYRLS